MQLKRNLTIRLQTFHVQNYERMSVYWFQHLTKVFCYSNFTELIQTQLYSNPDETDSHPGSWFMGLVPPVDSVQQLHSLDSSQFWNLKLSHIGTLRTITILLYSLSTFHAVHLSQLALCLHSWFLGLLASIPCLPDPLPFWKSLETHALTNAFLDLYSMPSLYFFSFRNHFPEGENG